MSTSTGRIVLASLGTAAVLGSLVTARWVTTPTSTAADGATSTGQATTSGQSDATQGDSNDTGDSSGTDQGSSGTDQQGTGSSTDGSDGSSGSSDASASSGSSDTRQYTGRSVATRYGDVQVRITVQGSQITDIQVIAYPDQDHHDQQINAAAIPILVSDALEAQSADIDSVSGATFTSEGYKQSLQSAIDEAGL